MMSIHLRPPEVDDRVMHGRREGDSIKGAGNKSSVGVQVERPSRLVQLARMDAAAAALALADHAKLNPISAQLRQSRPTTKARCPAATRSWRTRRV